MSYDGTLLLKSLALIILLQVGFAGGGDRCSDVLRGKNLVIDPLRNAVVDMHCLLPDLDRLLNDLLDACQQVLALPLGHSCASSRGCRGPAGGAEEHQLAHELDLLLSDLVDLLSMPLFSLELREPLCHDDLVLLRHRGGDDLLNTVQEGGAHSRLFVCPHLVHQVTDHSVALESVMLLLLCKFELVCMLLAIELCLRLGLGRRAHVVFDSVAGFQALGCIVDLEVVIIVL